MEHEYQQSDRTQELSILDPVRGEMDLARQLIEAGGGEGAPCKPLGDIGHLIMSAAIVDVFPPSGLLSFNQKLEVVNIFLDHQAWKEGLGILEDPRIELSHNGDSVSFCKVKNKSLEAAKADLKN